MPVIEVGGLTFTFPDECEASKLDEWGYYRNQFQGIGNNVRVACSKCSADLICKACGAAKNTGIKACDIVAVFTPVTWLIEVKDYRRQQRTKAIGLADEVALKVRDSLAVILGAKANAAEEGEKEFAVSAASCSHIRVVLHLEQPTIPVEAVPACDTTGRRPPAAETAREVG
jgi:hypothetical protein